MLNSEIKLLFYIQKTIKQVCISYRRLPINLHSLPGAALQGPAWGISFDLLSFLTRPCSCQILQTSLCSLEQTITEGSLFRPQDTSDLQLFATIPLRPLGQAQSLFGLPQPLNYSNIFYIMIISIYAVKYPYNLFSKHGAFDAKTQEEPALLGQEDSGGTERRGQGVTVSHGEGHMAWGINPGQHCRLGNILEEQFSSGEKLWGKSPVTAFSADAFKKGFWRQCGAAVQLTFVKGEGNAYILFPGWMEESVPTLEVLSRKRLKLWSGAVLGNGVTYFGLLITGAQIKNRSVCAPRTGLKTWKKQLVLLHLRTCPCDGSQCLWPLWENKEQ